MTPKATILIVEDEGLIAQDLERRLLQLGYAVCGSVASGEEAIRQAEAHQPALIFMDIGLRGVLDGIEAAQLITMRWPIPIVYVTSYTDDATLHRASLTKPSDYLLKPFRDQRLQEAIERALARAERSRRTQKAYQAP